MIDHYPILLNSVYAYGCGALVVLASALLIARGRGAGFRKAWKPLAPLVHGTFKIQSQMSVMTGSYHGHPVTARIWSGGRGAPSTFLVEMGVPPGGRDWEITYRSEQLLGREAWRAATQDPALQSRLDTASVASRLQNWPHDTVFHYDAVQGILALRQPMFAPSAEHFNAQLAVLESLAEANRQLNGSQALHGPPAVRVS